MSSRLGRQIASFASISLLASFAPFVLLPIISRTATPEGWVGILTAQAVGGLGAVVMMLGWSVDGQARVALADSDEARRALYAASLHSRALAAAVVLPVGGLLTWWLDRSAQPADAVLMYVATALAGLSTAWFSTGMGRADWILRFEIGPKLIALVVAAVAMVSLGQIWVYPASLIVAFLVGLISFHRRVQGVAWPRTTEVGRPVRGWRTWGPAVVGITGALYASAPLPIAGIVGAANPSLASADKLYRYGLLAASALANALQPWALDREAPRQERRVARAAVYQGGCGLVGALGLWALGPLVSRLLFGQQVEATYDVCGWYALAFLAVNVGTTLIRNVLVPMKRVGHIARVTVLTLVVGGPVIVVAGERFAAVGVAAGFGASELLSALGLAAGLATLGGARRLRRPEQPRVAGRPGGTGPGGGHANS